MYMIFSCSVFLTWRWIPNLSLRAKIGSIRPWDMILVSKSIYLAGEFNVVSIKILMSRIYTSMCSFFFFSFTAAEGGAKWEPFPRRAREIPPKASVSRVYINNINIYRHKVIGSFIWPQFEHILFTNYSYQFRFFNNDVIFYLYIITACLRA